MMESLLPTACRDRHFKISIAHVAAALAAELPYQANGASDATPNQLKTWAEVDAYTAKRTGAAILPVCRIFRFQ